MPLNTRSNDESLVKKRISRQTKLKVTVVAMAIAALVIYLIFDIALEGPLTSLLMNRDQLVASVQSWGIFAPLLRSEERRVGKECGS